jgi:hypothetical protein
MYNQLISAVVSFARTNATRTMEKMMIMTVSEKRLMSASFFLHGIRTFHSIKTGIVITAHGSVEKFILVQATNLPRP